jgi:hypothetical protein
LRAAHHAYYWINGLRDAIVELSAALQHRSVDAVSKDIAHHLHAIYALPLADAQHKSTFFVDDMKCYTDYEPRSVREISLKDLAIGGFVSEQNATLSGWKFVIYENLVNQNLVKKSIQMGYQDFKHLLHFSGSEVVPLSLHFVMNKPGPVIIFLFLFIFYLI